MNKSLYEEVYNFKNLICAWKKARKRKTKKPDIREFEEYLAYNLKMLHDELKNEIYFPELLETFIVRDPKTRKISKARFKDRNVHHALINIIEPIFEPTFIYDSCANRKGKGTLFAIKRLEKFIRKVTHNLHAEAFYLKADIKHYFEEVDHKILLNIIKRKITDEKTLKLIEKILENGGGASARRNATRQLNLPIFC